MIDLPDCDELFLRFLDPWYDDDDRTRRGFRATRPDMIQQKNLIGRTVEDMVYLAEECRSDVVARIDRMLVAARRDWPAFLPASGEMNDDWLAAIDEDYDRERIQRVIDHSDPNDYSNDYLVTCCEFGAVIGQLLRSAVPRLEWHLGWPYWESALFDTQTGTLIPVFHWAVKKMSEYGVDDGLVDKVGACAGILNDEQGSDTDSLN